MRSELFNRTISSFILIIFIFLSALVSDYVFLSILFIVIILSWIEWLKIIEKTSFKKIYRLIHIVFFLLYLS